MAVIKKSIRYVFVHDGDCAWYIVESSKRNKLRDFFDTKEYLENGAPDFAERIDSPEFFSFEKLRRLPEGKW